MSGRGLTMRMKKIFRMLKLIITYLCAFFLMTSFAANSQDQTEKIRRNYQVKPAVDNIVVDGIFNEETWKTGMPSTGFFMSYPVDNRQADSARQTLVKLAFDGQYLYIAATCLGDGNKYIIQSLKRDNEINTGDAFGVVIDPVNERTNGFVFGVNPMGVQTELLVSGKTGRREVLMPGRRPQGVNIAWDNKWFSEVKRSADRWDVEIAIPFKTLRFDEGKKVWGINFFRIDATTNSIHTWEPVPIEFQEIDLGYTGNLLWETSPDKVKSNISVIPYLLTGVSNDFEEDAFSKELKVGVDGKVALTSSLNFDLTVNPNFSQVEIDEQVTNLTLFDIQLPEKRLFFLENSDIFEDFGIPPMRPFLSRKIGLDEYGTPIPILFGARLSGNVNKDLRIGLMNMQTRQTDDFDPQNYTSVAFHQKVLARSVVKGFFHNRQELKTEVENFNRNAGLEFLYRSPDGRLQAFAGYSKSFDPEKKDQNYFYNSGAGYDSKKISVYTNLAGVGENYKSDLGYIRGQNYYDAERDTVIRVGVNHNYTRAGYTFYAKNSAKIISNQLSINNILDYGTDMKLLANSLSFNYTLMFTNTSIFTASFTANNSNLLFPFTFTDSTPLTAGKYLYNNSRIGFDSDTRKLFSFTASALYGGFYNGTRSQLMFGLKYRVQPWGNFSVKVEHNNLVFPDNYGVKELLNITPRIDINFSRELFWTTFMQYETQSDNFNINSRLQWRFQPMSDIYLVYTDNYSIENRIPKYRALVLKLNYWLNL